MQDEIYFDQFLDAKGLSCPLPLLKMKQLLNRMPSGQVIHIVTTDGGSVRDFRSFAEQAGHELLLDEKRGDEYYFWLKKS